MENFKFQIEEIRMFESWSVSVFDFEELFDQIIDAIREVNLTKHKKEAIDTIKAQLSDLMTAEFDHIKENFWVGLNVKYSMISYANLKRIESLLVQNFRSSSTEVKQYGNEFEKSTYEFTINAVDKRMRNISKVLLDTFKKQFLFIDDIPRKWESLCEEEIENLFKTKKKYVELLLQQFTKLRLIAYPVRDVIQYESNFDDEWLKGRFVKLLAEKENSFRGLFTKEDLYLATKEISDELYQVLDIAKRKHSATPLALPTWAWIAMAYLGYDDALRLIGSSWLIPVILSVLMFGVLHYFNKKYYILKIFNMCKDYIIKKFEEYKNK